MDGFIQNISFAISTHNTSDNIEELIRSLIDKYAPLKARFVSDRPKASWVNAELPNEKRGKRRLERRWRNTGLEVDKIAFKNQKKQFDKLIKAAHTDDLSQFLNVLILL